MQTAIHLQEAGLTVVRVDQTYGQLNEGCQRLEALVLSHGLNHGGHPVLCWNVRNVVVRRSPAGEIKPAKDDEKKRIDGISALVTGLARVVRQPKMAATQEAVFHRPPSSRRRDALHDELQGRGVRCWLDQKQMLPGDDIYDSVDRGIRVWDKVLLVCSESSLTSSWVEDEIDKALEKERKLRKERGEKVHAIIPLDLDGYLFKGWQDGRASVIRKRLAANFRGWDRKAEPPAALDPVALERVVLALRADAGGREPEPVPKI